MNSTRRKIIFASTILPFLMTNVLGEAMAKSLAKNGADVNEEDKILIQSLVNATSIEKIFSLLGVKSDNKSSAKIKIIHKQIHQNGRQTPFTVESLLPNTSQIAFLVEKNQTPFCINFKINKAIIPKIEFTVKVAHDCEVYALVKSKDVWYYHKSRIVIVRPSCAI